MDAYHIEFAQVASPDEIPNTIKDCFSQLEQVRKRVVQAQDKADAAYRKAKEASRVDPNVFNRDEAIKALQKAAVAIADSQIDQADAVKVSFEYEKVLSDVCKYLFMLGVANVTANRMVVRNLTMQLDHASEEELDAFAREELRSVIRQLKDQEDLLNRINRLEEIVREQQDTLDLLNRKIAGTENGNTDSEEATGGLAIPMMRARINELQKLVDDQDERLAKLEQNNKNS